MMRTYTYLQIILLYLGYTRILDFIVFKNAIGTCVISSSSNVIHIYV